MVISIFYLLKCNIYSMTSGRLSNCYRDEINDANDNVVANNRTNKNKTIKRKSFNRTRPGDGLVGLQLTFVVYIPRTKNVEALRLNDFS